MDIVHTTDDALNDEFYLFLAELFDTSINEEPQRHGGSNVVKRPNIPRGCDTWYQKLYSDYFSDDAI